MLLLCLFLFHLQFQHACGGWFWNSEVCYDNYGCFSIEPPFSNSKGYLPESPEDMNVKLILYTKNRAPYDTTGKLPRTFNSSRDTKLIIHGYRNNVREDWVTNMAFALLQKGDFNVFLLDWEEGASRYFYHQSVANTRIVAAVTAKIFYNMAKTYDIDLTTIHMIGFSLGAHVAGYIGNAIPGIGRITGLDPAGSAFEQTSPEVRLDPEDARFVDVIHTDADGLFTMDLSPGFGTKQPMGHVDFYVNGGINQPGCKMWGQLLWDYFWYWNPYKIGCSHRRAVEVFIESITSDCKFISSPCAELPNVPCNASAAENWIFCLGAVLIY